jgi:hypothetical protein
LVSPTSPLLLWTIGSPQEPSTVPVIQITTAIPPQIDRSTTFSVSGEISNTSNGPVALHLLVDGKADKFVRLGTIDFPTETTISRSDVSSELLGLGKGSYSLVFYAVDSTGAISVPSSVFSVQVSGPTRTTSATVSQTPTATRPDSPSPTESLSDSPSATLSLTAMLNISAYTDGFYAIGSTERYTVE